MRCAGFQEASVAKYVVEQVNGNAVFRRNKIEAPSAIQAASSLTGRTVTTGREPGMTWIRQTNKATSAGSANRIRKTARQPGRPMAVLDCLCVAGDRWRDLVAGVAGPIKYRQQRML
jgi:hypothetical protein